MTANKPLNIVFAIPALGGGGAERVVLNLCRGLRQYENAQCHIVCFSAKRDYVVPADTDVRICPLPPKTLFGYRKRCARVLDDFILQNFGRPDAVFANITQTVKCLRLSRFPVFNILHCPPSIEYLRRQKGIKRWLRRKRVESDYSTHPAVCVSEGCREDFLRHFSIFQPVHVILNPIDPQELRREASAEESLAEIAALGDYIIHIGSFKEAKDHATLLRAYAQSGIKEKLVLLGQPSGKPEFLDRAHRLAEELGIKERVCFLGFKANPFPYLRHAKLFVLSSAYEGFAMVLAEAVALDVPVVSTDCPHGPREIVGDKFAHVLSPVGDTAALAKNIQAAVADPSRYTVPLRPDICLPEVCKQYIALIKNMAL